ncbi:hypothetical protein [Sorangium sp. So ce1335]|uniref:hypothetical protein n=1 Tax=Sorangium sp. So ce1335 TaxID=3133335 RepID=UPI003F612BD4
MEPPDEVDPPPPVVSFDPSEPHEAEAVASATPRSPTRRRGTLGCVVERDRSGRGRPEQREISCSSGSVICISLSRGGGAGKSKGKRIAGVKGES